MKNKGVIAAIVGILILGVVVTVNTKRLVSGDGRQSAYADNYDGSSAKLAGFGNGVSQSADSQLAGAGAQANNPQSPETANMGRNSPRPAAAPAPPDLWTAQRTEEKAAAIAEKEAAPAGMKSMEEGAVSGSGAENPSEGMEAAEDAEEMAAAKEKSDSLQMESIQPAPEVEISPLTGSRTFIVSESSSVDLLEEYENRLEEVEIRIRRMKEAEVSSNTDSYKSLAECEYRLWDTELNAIYQELLKNMGEDEKQSLKAEEREWMNRRDSDAHKASEKYKGGTLESLEYTASLAKSTKARAYELLENYGSCLRAGESTLKVYEEFNTAE